MLVDLKVNLQVIQYRCIKTLRRAGCFFGHHVPFRIAPHPRFSDVRGWECWCRYLWFNNKTSKR